MIVYLLGLLFSTGTIFANMTQNDVTIQTYEQHVDKYVEETSQVVSGGYKIWIDTLLNGVRKDAKIFEVGSGFGRDAKYIMSKGYQIQTSDIANSFLTILQKEGLKPKRFNILKDDFLGSYDVIFANSVFLHFTHEQLSDVLLKVKTSLNEDGFLAMVVKPGSGECFSDHKMGSPRFYCYWQQGEIAEKLERLGFKVIYNVLDEKEQKIFLIAVKR